MVGICGSRAGLIDLDGLGPARTSDLTQRVSGLTGDRFLDSLHANVLIETGPTDYETGGPGDRYIRSALTNGVHVVAISKDARVVYAGRAALARAHGAQLKISGATLAALPTIDLLQYNLAGCKILEVEGILTATANFMLSQMMAGLSFADALSERSGSA